MKLYYNNSIENPTHKSFSITFCECGKLCETNIDSLSVYNDFIMKMLRQSILSLNPPLKFEVSGTNIKPSLNSYIQPTAIISTVSKPVIKCNDCSKQETEKYDKYNIWYQFHTRPNSNLDHICKSCFDKRVKSKHESEWKYYNESYHLRKSTPAVKSLYNTLKLHIFDEYHISSNPTTQNLIKLKPLKSWIAFVAKSMFCIIIPHKNYLSIFVKVDKKDMYKSDYVIDVSNKQCWSDKGFFYEILLYPKSDANIFEIVYTNIKKAYFKDLEPN